ncbi:MAG: Dolichyl-phosphate-mannose-protein mannosyltransferase [Actinomycetia bacterium]|nr:Dolichyl-phosphate-mannose-protein mannosyltransferase [Actinomycetes bacterium]
MGPVLSFGPMSDLSTPPAPPVTPRGDGSQPEPDQVQATSAYRPPWWVVGLVALVLLVGIVLRLHSASVLWLDEALTVNLAKLPINQLHGALKRDGAPPLYYVLLHYWIQLFGDGPTAVRSLSAVFGLLALPCAWWSGHRLGRSRGPAASRITAWATVLILASSPYAIRYSTETRMYSLEILLVLLGYLALWRVLERPHIGRVAWLAVITGLLLYNQYWSLYLLAVVGAILLVQIWRTTGEFRRAATAAAVGLVAGGITFVPWLPTFLYQSAHTGTPWGKPVLPPTGAAYAFLDFAGSNNAEMWVLVQLIIVLLLLGVFARAMSRNQLEVDLRTVPGARWEAFVAVVGMSVALVLTEIAGSAVQGRYAAVFFPLFILVVGFAFTAFANVYVRTGLLVFVVALGLRSGIRNFREQRSQAGQVAAQIRPSAKAGDVVGFCPDQVGPSVSRLLPAGLQQSAFPNGQSPKYVNWVDYAKRNAAASPDAFAKRLERLAGSTHTIWMVWSPGYLTFDAKCQQVVQALRDDRPGVDLLQPDEGLFEREGLVRFAPKQTG